MSKIQNVQSIKYLVQSKQVVSFYSWKCLCMVIWYLGGEASYERIYKSWKSWPGYAGTWFAYSEEYKNLRHRTVASAFQRSFVLKLIKIFLH